MNIRFIGCPSSGKTTTAAMAFARLKETGLPAEFVPEYARQYIAQVRLSKNLSPKDPLVLSDEDQMRIMMSQAGLEMTMARVCGPEVAVIADTWSLNALLYMSEGQRASQQVEDFVKTMILPYTDLVFYASPIHQREALDPNRIHSYEQSLDIDARIQGILGRYAPDAMVVSLYGDAEMRTAVVLNAIFRRMRP